MFFHPLVSRWFSETLGTPTPAQLRGWSSIRERRHTLIAAPTGSGKTLAAFLTAIDELVCEGIERGLPDETRVLYVSPLKALSADIHKNLAEPRVGIQRLAEESGVALPGLSAAVRTGDTTAAERSAMLRTPPHILVTTPESLYLLLTSERGRQMLSTVRTVIVDEIHAVIGTRRGAHLALSLARLEALTPAPPLRIGLSATQKPVEDVARYLTGREDITACAIVDEGHQRRIDLALELPGSPLEAVMAQEVWEEYHERLAALIEQHTTTIVFVNTRRMAERLARHLTERLGEGRVTAHHGSLAKETRLDAEERLKRGGLKALVATASLELGIDIGHVDLVCQIGSPHRIATLLQRVGRAGHSVSGVPRGRLLPTSRDDLIECAALLRAVARGELDRVVSHDAPLDVLAQQVAAETASREWREDDLYALTLTAWPYRGLSRRDFDEVVAMVSEGFATRRGRRAALVHRDEVNTTLRARRGTRLLALTSGGAIPEVADYRVVLEPDDTFIGTLNEDFAIESMAGDVFQLGNASWRITQVGAGVVRVADAQGAPPSIPFWFGEAPARSDELSREVSSLRADMNRVLDAWDAGSSGTGVELSTGTRAAEWFARETGVGDEAARQAADYLADGRRTLGSIPTQDTLVLERFFDESGGMQLVLHAPFGSRINRAWALALRKRFCRQFNFELQAAATEDALLLSLGPQHSFPLADVFRYLHPATVRDILIQAFLDAPVFQTRWRWNATISLAVPRHRGGRKVAPQLQRMQADDLMAAVFPDAAACLENIPGDREIPDHPLVRQTVRDCLDEAMDLDALVQVLSRIHDGALHCVSRDTPEPSVFAHEILNARPYAFLDDAPLEERRTQAVQTRRTGRDRDGLGMLDASAIERVREEIQLDPRDMEELHDALLTVGVLTDADLAAIGGEAETPAAPTGAMMARALATGGRVTRLSMAEGLWVAAERLPELRAVHPSTSMEPDLVPPASRAARFWTRDEALTELVRGRLSIAGPVTTPVIARALGVAEPDAELALIRLESDGAVLRGTFTAGAATTEWCDRRLLARIHRYTMNRLRAQIAPVAPADFMRFLFSWQHVGPAAMVSGIDGLRAVLGRLDGAEMAARAWERHVLTARITNYDPSLLDMLCLTGEVGWARLSSGPSTVVGATPVALFLREHAPAWLALRKPPETAPARDARDGQPTSDASLDVSPEASSVLARLRAHGASFAHDLAAGTGDEGLRDEELRIALRDLVAAGHVSSDGFAGLRAIIDGTPVRETKRLRGVDRAGRWFALPAADDTARDQAIETVAWALLHRYGVVFRRLLVRESVGAAWREIVRVLRTLEARGDVRGGRFVTGVSGEQYALPDAVERLREVRRTNPDGRLLTISAADPLNLTGILTSDARVRASASTRLVYRDGVAIMAMEGDMLRPLAPMEPEVARQAAAAAAGRQVPVVAGYVGRANR